VNLEIFQSAESRFTANDLLYGLRGPWAEQKAVGSLAILQSTNTNPMWLVRAAKGVLPSGHRPPSLLVDVGMT
jgi:hypothetical protein